MNKLGPSLAIAILASSVVLAGPAEGQIVVTGALSAGDCPPRRIVTDRGANVRSVRRERNRYFAARPVYPPVERGAAARGINFEPFTSKYYPRGNEDGALLTPSSSIRGR
jgi:hypothetical protein